MARVLITDDSKFSRLFLKDIITRAGHNVIAEAEEGQHAVFLYLKLKPDIVFMDIIMPGLPGIEAITQIRKFDPQAKIILCSAMGNRAHVLEGFRAGANDFILKPFNLERVCQALRKSGFMDAS